MKRGKEAATGIIDLKMSLVCNEGKKKLVKLKNVQ